MTLAVAQASHDGTVWFDIKREYATDAQETIFFEATVPKDTRFVRFLTGQGVGSAEGACYHSNRFVVDSQFTIEPSKDA